MLPSGFTIPFLQNVQALPHIFNACFITKNLGIFIHRSRTDSWHFCRSGRLRTRPSFGYWSLPVPTSLDQKVKKSMIRYRSDKKKCEGTLFSVLTQFDSLTVYEHVFQKRFGTSSTLQLRSDFFQSTTELADPDPKPAILLPTRKTVPALCIVGDRRKSLVWYMKAKHEYQQYSKRTIFMAYRYMRIIQKYSAIVFLNVFG